MNRSDANEKGDVFRFDCIQPLTSLLVGERQRISCNLSALLSTKKDLMQNESHHKEAAQYNVHVAQI